ncbi:hypothetical protein [Natrialba taiwanensis]|uniref:Uncharacterized protein n=1 Tax=Natrialba taiwanensis DSM 12281 TaxID=1230458 RepID=M0A0C0_9EURY|nr:hypothetical protein [Natrialba taiwanensis]ELY92205.1 hypothetical protein C484_09461 [Natrialba taiwanensis DSM 12281]
MTAQPRYEPRIEDETLYLDHDGDRLEVGPMEHIVDRIGETYTLEYTEEQSAAAWLQTDSDNTITFDVREVVGKMTHTQEFVANLENCPLDQTTPDGEPKRTALFVDLITEIWDSKGNLDG